MKEVLKVVVDKYGTSKIKYGLILFGTTPVSSKYFGESFPTQEAFKNFINIVRRPSGKPDLVMALEEGRKLFERAPKRPKAHQVLVVVMDDKSVNKPEDLKRAFKSMEDKQIKIIAVAVGPGADTYEMEQITGDKDRVVQVAKNVKPEKLAEKIMTKATTKGLSNIRIW